MVSSALGQVTTAKGICPGEVTRPSRIGFMCWRERLRPENYTDQAASFVASSKIWIFSLLTIFPSLNDKTKVLKGYILKVSGRFNLHYTASWLSYPLKSSMHSFFSVLRTIVPPLLGVSLSAVSTTCGRPESKNIKGKFPEINNS